MKVFAGIFVIALFLGCGKSTVNQSETALRYNSFKDVPGVTANEIQAIEALQKNTATFIYGTTPSTEAFYAEGGEIKGFTVLFSNWLSEFFGIPFKPEIYSWSDLIAGLEAGKIDFTGELTASDERRKVWFMTDSIAERPLKIFTLAGSTPLYEIERARLPRYGFLEGTTTINRVTVTMEPGSYEIIPVANTLAAYDLLKNGEIDLFVNEGPGEASLDIFTDVVVQDFFPPVYEPVSLSTRNPDLRPIISVVQKALQDDALRYFTQLYALGYRDYMRYKLSLRLSDEEKTYIRNNPVIRYGAEPDNYPFSFYDTRIKEWQGIAPDLLIEIEALTGLTFQRVNDQYANWSTILHMLENGDVAIVSDLIRYTTREGRFLWPRTIVAGNNYTLLSKSDFRDITINEIPYVRVGLITDTAYTTLFRGWFPNHEYVIEYDSAEKAFAALLREEVDMVMARQTRILDLTNYRERVGYKTNVVFGQAVESSFGINKDEAILCSIIDKAFELIDTEEMSGKWVRKTYDYRAKLMQVQRPLLFGIALLLFLVLALLSALFIRNRNEGKRLEGLVQKRTAELKAQHTLMREINDASTLLLDSNAGDYFSAIVETMKMICRTAEVDHVNLWQNHRKNDGRLYHKQVCKWMREGLIDDYSLLEFVYQDTVPNWEELLSQGKSINGPVHLFANTERAHLNRYNIQSILAVPIFMGDEFWGFVSFDNCDRERVYTAAEENFLRSWGLLAVGAMTRGQIALNMQYTLTKLEAVISNYKGIIWSIDNNRTVTTFNGQHVKTLGIQPQLVEGKPLTLVQLENKYMDIAAEVEKTFREGPHEWISDIDGGIYQSYTQPIRDNNNNIVGIVGSTDEVTEFIKLQRDLKTAVEAAEVASQSKSKFLANMSHEMRTPLNAIIGLSEMELGTGNLPEGIFVNVEKIYSAGMNLLGIINDILDISKIESGKFTLVPVVYDVPSMINDTIILNIVRTGSKPIEFRLHVDGTLPTKFEGDELRLKQIFNNLLSNAIKYTEKGYVDWSISTVREGNRYKVTSTVADTGRGITEEDQKKLFSDYYQTDLKANYYVEGTGLGLAITLNLIKLMNGTIKLTSEFRKGSSFTVEFYQDVVDDDVIGDEAAVNLTQFRYTAQRRSLNDKLVRVNMSYATVLVVDDVVTNLDVARGMLKPYKLNIECVTSGLEAINRVREEKVQYSAIFMDHMMPGMDGIETVRVIREEIGTEYAKKVPIIALTANALIGNDQMFIDNGFQAFLSKPIDILRMDQILHQFVRDWEKEKEVMEMDQEAAAEPVDEKNKNSAFIKDLEGLGLNATESLSRFANDEESYLRILGSFVTHAPSFIENAKSSLKDINSYRIAVHSIKGSGRSIGAEELGNMAEKLEHAAKQGDTAFIEANNGAFIETAEKFIAALTAYLETSTKDEDVGKPEMPAPDMKVLASLKQAAENYDMANVKAAIKTLDTYRYQSQPDLVKWLQEKAGKSRFEDIQKRIEEILS